MADMNMDISPKAEKKSVMSESEDSNKYMLPLEAFNGTELKPGDVLKVESVDESGVTVSQESKVMDSEEMKAMSSDQAEKMPLSKLEKSLPTAERE